MRFRIIIIINRNPWSYPDGYYDYRGYSNVVFPSSASLHTFSGQDKQFCKPIPSARHPANLPLRVSLT